MIASRKRILAGALIGAVSRGAALFFFLSPLPKDMEPYLLPRLLIPSIVVGAIIGAIAASRSTVSSGVAVGALFSMATFSMVHIVERIVGKLVHRPIELPWEVIRFSEGLCLLFGIAGVLSGYLSFKLVDEPRSDQAADEFGQNQSR